MLKIIKMMIVMITITIIIIVIKTLVIKKIRRKENLLKYLLKI